LTFARDLRRSRLRLQERELESEDIIFIIHPNSNYNYQNFTIGLYHIGSGRVSGHLVSGHFEFRIISDRVRYRVVQYEIISCFELYRISTDQVSFLHRIGFYHLYLRAWDIHWSQVLSQPFNYRLDWNKIFNENESHRDWWNKIDQMVWTASRS
jgi:hypothetical protein